jgi:hypothetical protein
MMTACFLPNGDKKNKDLLSAKYRYIKPLNLSCNVKIENLNEILQKGIKKFTEINIYGFNTKTNEYWLKNMNKYESKLYFKITIIKKEKILSMIIITPIIGSNSDINILTIKIINLLKIYDTNILC